jgi:hypothetical protein
MVMAMRAASRPHDSGGRSSKNSAPTRPPPPALPSRRTPCSEAMAFTRMEKSGCTSSTRTPMEFAMRTWRDSSPRLTTTFSMRGSAARAARSARSTMAMRSASDTLPSVLEP